MTSCYACKANIAEKWKKKYCSDECFKESRRKQFIKNSRRISKLQSQAKRDAILICNECGCSYIRRFGGYKYCSTRCRVRSGSSNGNSIRRARRGGKKEFGMVHFYSVYARDEGICNHCKSELLLSDRGMQKDKSPVVDHVMPLAIGGEHDIRNTQILCRKCNTIKGCSFSDIDKEKIIEISRSAN